MAKKLLRGPLSLVKFARCYKQILESSIEYPDLRRGVKYPPNHHNNQKLILVKVIGSYWQWAGINQGFNREKEIISNWLDWLDGQMHAFVWNLYGVNGHLVKWPEWDWKCLWRAWGSRKVNTTLTRHCILWGLIEDRYHWTCLLVVSRISDHLPVYPAVSMWYLWKWFNALAGQGSHGPNACLIPSKSLVSQWGIGAGIVELRLSAKDSAYAWLTGPASFNMMAKGLMELPMKVYNSLTPFTQ